jgi:hypothetical protein
MSLALTALLLLSFVASPSAAQIEKVDQACITAFNKGMRKTSRTHAKIVRKCMAEFLNGSLTTTMEECIAVDSGGKLLRTMVNEAGTMGYHCTFGLPSFGVSDLQPGLSRSVLTQFGLLHGT